MGKSFFEGEPSGQEGNHSGDGFQKATQPTKSFENI
jgi:hypothetical protein